VRAEWPGIALRQCPNSRFERMRLRGLSGARDEFTSLLSRKLEDAREAHLATAATEPTPGIAPTATLKTPNRAKPTTRRLYQHICQRQTSTFLTQSLPCALLRAWSASQGVPSLGATHRIFCSSRQCMAGFSGHVLFCDSNRIPTFSTLPDRCLEQDIEKQKHRTVPDVSSME